MASPRGFTLAHHALESNPNVRSRFGRAFVFGDLAPGNPALRFSQGRSAVVASSFYTIPVAGILS